MADYYGYNSARACVAYNSSKSCYCCTIQVSWAQKAKVSANAYSVTIQEWTLTLKHGCS